MTVQNDVPAVLTHSDHVSVAELEALASQLNEAVREYKENASSRDLVGQDLGYRRKIAAAASHILNETKVPEEQWNEQSISVRMIRLQIPEELRQKSFCSDDTDVVVADGRICRHSLLHALGSLRTHPAPG